MLARAFFVILLVQCVQCVFIPKFFLRLSFQQEYLIVEEKKLKVEETFKILEEELPLETICFFSASCYSENPRYKKEEPILTDQLFFLLDFN